MTKPGDFDAALSADREAATIYVARNSTEPERYRDSVEASGQQSRNRPEASRPSDEEITNELDRHLLTDDD